MEWLIIALCILGASFRAKHFRGTLGEATANLNMWLALSPEQYHTLHNVIIPSTNGTTQIDHLVVSSFGVFIIETKNMKGWIFGSEKQAKWTQSLYGKNYSFQNPIRQTFRQKRVLSEYLNLDEALVHTVIYFVGNCTFKTILPSNVINHGLGRYIKQYQKPVLDKDKVSQIMGQLGKLRSDPSLTTRKHIQSLQARHSSNTICPRCGSALTERSIRKGPRAGHKFIGCNGYPKCNFTKNINV